MFSLKVRGALQPFVVKLIKFLVESYFSLEVGRFRLGHDHGLPTDVAPDEIELTGSTSSASNIA